MTTTTETRGAKTNKDITALLKARNTLLWVVSREEVRVERALIESAAGAAYKVRFWDCATGITDSKGETIDPGQTGEAPLDYILNSTERSVYVLRDLHKWLGDPVVLRKVRTLARVLQGQPKDTARAVIILTPSAEIPLELQGQATVVDYPIPDREEVARIVDETVSALPEEFRDKALTNGTRDAAIDAAVGLTAEEVSNCLARSLVTSKRIEPTLVSGEKKRVIAREKLLTWHDPDPRGLDAVGGLETLKGWLRARRQGFTAKAREYGLPAPKGMMLVGIPGTGKSLTAKAVATAWQMPLLRLDMGALQSKYVGESQANIRKALQIAEAVSPCVLWLDEIEKALAGATGPQGDGGVSADALGTVLSWMQEREGSVFVVATANDVRSLPPELLRKGRFDEVFWIDLPTTAERSAILSSTLKQYGRGAALTEDDLLFLATVTEGFTGAEIAALVPEAMFAAFADGERQIMKDDVLTAARTVVPLSKTAAEKIDDLRKWAKGKARPASLPEEVKAQGAARQIEI